MSKTKGKFESPRGGSKAAKPAAARQTGRAAAPTGYTAQQQRAGAPTGYTMQPQRTPAPKPKKKKKTGLIVTLCVIAAVVIAVGCFAAYYLHCASIASYNKIFPGVHIAGVDVSGMTKLEAEAAVEEAVSENYSETLEVQLPDRVLTFSPEQTKAGVNVSAAVDSAWSYGRSGSVFAVAKAYKAAQSTVYDIDLETSLSLDAGYIEDLINETAADVDCEPVQSVVSVDQDAGTITVTKGTRGYHLDTEGLYDAVYNAFSVGDLSPLTWDYEEIMYDEIDLQSVYDTCSIAPQDAFWDEATEELVADEPGYTFDIDAAQADIDALEDGSVYTITLEPVDAEVTLAELQELYFRDTLSSYDSPHTALTGRTTNLTLACNAINGTILSPGEEFSFNGIVGERTAAKGYQEATVYVNGDSVGELGGGVCQVASTLYMCTLLANLEVTDRTEHMYAVTYVPQGMDATVYWGVHDYCFKNNTEYPIRIDASVSGGYVHITFVGTKTDDTHVEMTYDVTSTTSWEQKEVVDESKPVGYYEVTQTAYTGYTVTTYRHIIDADGKEISVTKEADSVYNKRDRIVTVGPTSKPAEETTPTETTPTETTPAETTPAETTPAETTPGDSGSDSSGDYTDGPLW